MGRYFALALQMPIGGAKNKKIAAKIPMPKINFGALIFILLAVFSLLYLFQINNVSTKGYEVSRLQKQVTELEEAAKRLELESASLRSIQGIEAEIRTLNMVPSGGVNYINHSGVSYRPGE